ncbi:hypothetical protein GCM10028807_57570 [Spirosoma daeguense]
MKAFWRDLRDHLRTDFRLDLYVATALWAAVLLTINYSIDLEDAYIDVHLGKPIRGVLYFLLYGTAYYVSVAIWAYFHRRTDIWRKREFWLRSLVALISYSTYASFYAYADWSRQILDGQIFIFAYYCFHNLQSIVTIVLPLYLFYRLLEPQLSQFSPDSFYGMTPKRKGLVLYAILLALMIPLITLASFQPDFLQSYPTYHDTNANEVLGVPEWVTVLIYELCYGWDFVPTELIFRGFLVIGMSRVLGPGAVLPMVVWYCSIHFGRPLGEAVSSLFGGYILGVLALSTRSIWGGLLIHIGIAWGMEIAAFLQK